MLNPEMKFEETFRNARCVGFELALQFHRLHKRLLWLMGRQRKRRCYKSKLPEDQT